VGLLQFWSCLSANLELSISLTLWTPESMLGPESVHPCAIPVEYSILRASPEPEWPPAMGDQGQSSLTLVPFEGVWNTTKWHKTILS